MTPSSKNAVLGQKKFVSSSLSENHDSASKYVAPTTCEQRPWHLTIGLRLLIGSAAVILLVAGMALLSIQGTNALLDANEEVSHSLGRAAESQEQARLVEGWHQIINTTQADLNLILRGLIVDMVENQSELTVFQEDQVDPLGRFLASVQTAEIERRLEDAGTTIAALAEAREEILSASLDIQAIWQPRHAGLAEALNLLKRNIDYWNLKVANTIFIRSSMLELLPDDLSDTPVESFRRSPVYAEFAGEFPVLPEMIASAAQTNKTLYAAADDLSTLMLQGKWDMVRVFYRDNFPTQIKSILVDIDRVLAVEQQSIAAQQQAMNILNGPLKVASEQAVRQLIELSGLIEATSNGQQQQLAAAARAVVEHREKMQSALTTMRQVNYAAPVLVIILAAIAGLAISRSVTAPLKKAVVGLSQIARGEADLTQRLPIRSGDEVGQLANSFNRLMERQQEMVTRVRHVAEDLTSATGLIRNATGEVSQGAEKQRLALLETEKDLKANLQDIQEIAVNTANMVDATRQTTSATLEMGATIEEIAEQIDQLFNTADEVSSSTQQMNVSGRHIGDRVEQLVDLARQTTAAVNLLDQRIVGIEKNAVKTDELSRRAAEDAQVGLQAVETSLQGITSLNGIITQTGAAIQNLRDRSEAIGLILTVIDEIADQTSLLALNATILAAQAGERGKGFGVVADEIRDLADRTAVSTKEIASIIRGLQDAAGTAVKVVNAGQEQAGKEVARARTASEALVQIRQSTETARTHVAGIVEAAHAQVEDSRQISGSVGEISTMSTQMATALLQLTAGIQQNAVASEHIRDIAGRVKSSTEEQAAGSRHIAETMETIRETIGLIDRAAHKQSERTKQAVGKVSSISMIADLTAGKSDEMGKVVKLLSQQTETLNSEVGAFKV